MRLLALVSFVALAGVAAAQGTVSVQSGEHETFSRLVFPAPPSLAWTVERGDSDLVTVLFDPPVDNLSVATVFARIPRARISDVSTVPGGLALRLGCDCALEIGQIASDHIVIDVNDANPGREAADARPMQPPLRVPLFFPRSSMLLAGLPIVEAESDVPPGNRKDLGLQSTRDRSMEALPQVSVREHRRTGLVAAPFDTMVAPRPIAVNCSLESAAEEILSSDPVEALAAIPALRIALIDALDNIVQGAVRDLAISYLKAGFGTEANQILSSMSAASSSDLRLVADALDGDPDFSSTAIDVSPACGPASVTLLLISGTLRGDWDLVDETAFLRFVDRLPISRRADLEDRLREGLERLGRTDTVARLAALPPIRPESAPATEVIVAAGTGADAVRATIGLLAGHEDGTDRDRTNAIENGVALMPAVPDGRLREDFQKQLAEELISSGHVTDAVAMIARNHALAPQMLGYALRNLPPERAVEVAVRLRPFLPDESPELRRAAEILRGFGLASAASEFEPDVVTPPMADLAPLPVSAPASAPASSGAAQAWIERDFRSVVEADETAEGDPRRTLASTILARNAASDGDLADFAAAKAAVDRSRALSGDIRALLGTELP